MLISNGAKFPVLVNEVQKAEQQENADGSLARGQFLGDDFHSVMGKNSHLKALADVFNVGNSIMSVGDVLITFGAWLWIYAPAVWLTLIAAEFLKLTSKKNCASMVVPSEKPLQIVPRAKRRKT